MTNRAENQFFLALFAVVALGIVSVITWSDAFVAELIRIAILEAFQ